METDKLAILRYYNDLPTLLKNIRKKDLKELNTVAGAIKATPKSLLMRMIDNSIEPKSVFYGERLLLCAGQRVLEGQPDHQIGDIWLFSTKWADKYPLAYTKACKRLLDIERRRFRHGVYIMTSSEYPEAMRLNEIIGLHRQDASADINGVRFYVYFAEGL